MNVSSIVFVLFGLVANVESANNLQQCEDVKSTNQNASSLKVVLSDAAKSDLCHREPDVVNFQNVLDRCAHFCGSGGIPVVLGTTTRGFNQRDMDSFCVGKDGAKDNDTLIYEVGLLEKCEEWSTSLQEMKFRSSDFIAAIRKVTYAQHLFKARMSEATKELRSEKIQNQLEREMDAFPSDEKITFFKKWMDKRLKESFRIDTEHQRTLMKSIEELEGKAQMLRKSIDEELPKLNSYVNRCNKLILGYNSETKAYLLDVCSTDSHECIDDDKGSHVGCCCGVIPASGIFGIAGNKENPTTTTTTTTAGTTSTSTSSELNVSVTTVATSTTSSAFLTASYVLGSDNTDACPMGTAKITSQSECESAAAALGKSWGRKENAGSHPSGCYQLVATVFWNINSGSARSGAQPVCRQAVKQASPPPSPGPPPQATAPSPAVGMNKVSYSMATGVAHTIFITKDGAAYATGDNANGQLGDGTTVAKSTPVEVMTSALLVAAGRKHTIYVKKGGTAYATGHSGYGQLGTGSTTADETKPVQVMTGVLSVVAGYDHTVFHKQDETVYATGRNPIGQLGDGTTTDRARPVKVMEGIMTLAAGYYHTVYVKNDGTAYGTGRNWEGQLGIDTLSFTSKPVKLMTGVVAVATGGWHTVFINQAGVAYATGFNPDGQLGDGSKVNKNKLVMVMTGVVAVAAGSRHTVYIKKNGEAHTTGQNTYGQLADGTKAGKTKPVKVASNVVSAAGGGWHTLFIKQDNAAYATGRNTAGQLGDSTTTDKSSMVKVMDSIATVKSRRLEATTTTVTEYIEPCGRGYEESQPEVDKIVQKILTTREGKDILTEYDREQKSSHAEFYKTCGQRRLQEEREDSISDRHDEAKEQAETDPRSARRLAAATTTTTTTTTTITSADYLKCEPPQNATEQAGSALKVVFSNFTKQELCKRIKTGGKKMTKEGLGEICDKFCAPEGVPLILGSINYGFGHSEMDKICLEPAQKKFNQSFIDQCHDNAISFNALLDKTADLVAKLEVVDASQLLLAAEAADAAMSLQKILSTEAERKIDDALEHEKVKAVKDLVNRGLSGVLDEGSATKRMAEDTAAVEKVAQELSKVVKEFLPKLDFVLKNCNTWMTGVGPNKEYLLDICSQASRACIQDRSARHVGCCCGYNPILSLGAEATATTIKGLSAFESRASRLLAAGAKKQVKNLCGEAQERAKGKVSQYKNKISNIDLSLWTARQQIKAKQYPTFYQRCTGTVYNPGNRDLTTTTTTTTTTTSVGTSSTAGGPASPAKSSDEGKAGEAPAPAPAREGEATGGAQATSAMLSFVAVVGHQLYF